MLHDLVPDLTAAGVDIIQLREKELEAGDVIRIAEPLVAACAEASIPLIINDRPDVALATGASGVHLGQNDVPVDVARKILGSGAIVGRSTHARAEIDAELRGPAAVDYTAVGPVKETPTKAERPDTGIGLVRYAEERLTPP